MSQQIAEEAITPSTKRQAADRPTRRADAHPPAPKSARRRSSLTPAPRATKISWPKILQAAQQRFGIERFRSGQKAVLEQVFAGHSVLGLMPTGAGKSLTYQLPALFLPKPVVVVSPLIALMQDQQQHAAEANLAVEKMDSTLNARELHRAEEEIAGGIAQLIYVTPERLETPEFLDELKAAGGISLLVVDEAHCIAQWGHDFRPAYLCIGQARKVLGMPPVLALTATATKAVVDEILDSLHAHNARIVNAGTERTNLHLRVHATVNTEAKLARVTSLLEQEEGTGIIYTASVRTADELHAWLSDHAVSVGRYHGKMCASERKRVQDEFMAGSHKVMIATKAFGLGIDKPDIRFVFHYEFPDSLETYYQEAGRAGRDGLPSRAVLLYRLEDKRIQSFFMAGRYPTLHDLEAVWEAIRGTAAPTTTDHPATAHANQPANVPSPDASLPTSAPLDAKDIAQRSGVSQRKTAVVLHLLEEAGLIRKGKRGFSLKQTHAPTDAALVEMLQVYTDRARNDRDRLGQMMHYAETSGCRMQVIRQYFGEPKGEPCGRCDNCEHPAEAQLLPSHARTTPAETDTPLQHSGLLAVSAGEARRADQAHDGSAVVRIETPIGTIVTTAPETLSRAVEESSVHVGDRVRHKQFGDGKVLDTHDNVAVVRFPAVGEKTVKVAFLEASS